VLYTGVTRDLKKRVFMHREGMVDGFSKKYEVKKLVYFEKFKDIKSAIGREKQIKAGSRKKKIALIEEKNQSWKDLYNNL
jgi:putative endonuclease